MEHLWSFLEREWIDVTNKSILDSQTKFDEVSNKVTKALKSTGSFLNDLAGNEPIALPHTLWFGILDLAQNLIQKSTQTSTYGLCYYLAIESLNKAPSSFIQFKAVEILLHLHNIDSKMFSMIDDDIDQYIKKLNENKSFEEKFQNLLLFIKGKYLEDLKILSENIGKEKEGKGKGKSLSQNSYLKREQTSNSNVIDIIADEMTCPISSEPEDQLCILICQHTLSLNNLKLLKQKLCPKCREKIEENDIRYLPQNSIYKNLYIKFSESGHIIPPIKLENSDQIYDSDDSDNSEADLILAKKKKSMNSIIKLNSNISLSSILSRNSKKQHPTYQNIIKEINEKHYEKAESLCKEFLNFFPKSYSLRCILGFIYRCLKNYEQAHFYLKEAINLKPKEPIAYLICGEIFFWQSNYSESVNNLCMSIDYKVKINNVYIITGNSNLFHDCYGTYYYNIALRNDPDNYLCLKYNAFCYAKYGYYNNALEMLDKLLNINNDDSLILCYYGEILYIIGQYSKAISYFTKANIIDPENTHNLIKRAIAYYTLQDYNKVLLDLDKVIQLDPLNSLAYYIKCQIYYAKKDIDNSIMVFKKYKELLDFNDILAKTRLFHLEYLLNKNNSTELNNKLTKIKINQISNIQGSVLLLFVRCKVYIELKMYHEAMLDLDLLHSKRYGYEYNSYIHLLREYTDFWLYLNVNNNNDLSELGIVNGFSKHIYEKSHVYFISNLVNLNSELHQLQENEINSLSGKIISSKNEELHLNLPMLYFEWCDGIIWKINVKEILNKDCFIKFIIKSTYKDSKLKHYEHVLKYEDVLKLEGLGWIEYKLPKIRNNHYIQPSIEINGSINMQIDYFRHGSNREKITYIPNVCIGDLLPNFYKTCPNIPETFEDKYFSRKEMESLLELKDIINHL
ncbi:hypothetical protein RirG_115820 [Rhizophagus irregularis DAOM 197198w]|uniref:Uncharacterized protein n=1 Tax=Rhizophagus irregularis (strain DAOM 197198w) TaxID=1432141 RepID=A0A015L486_RHIIW|nr:hypothetical protein RirG_115820 [Rhizophagus irregularis DAOM 197198w]